MTKPAIDIASLLARWGRWIDRRPKAIVLAAILLAFLGGAYAAGHLTMQTSTAEMLSADLPFQKLREELHAAFPVLDGNLVVLVSGRTADQAEDAALALTTALRKRPDLVDWVFYPEGDAFFRKNGLLFLKPAELESLSNRIAAAEPLLGQLASDMSLRGLFDILDTVAKAVAERGEKVGELVPVLTSIGDTVDGVVQGRPEPLSWRALMSPIPLTPSDYHQIVLAQVRTGAGSEGGGAALAAIPGIAAGLGLDPAHGIEVQMTGDVPIGIDEVRAVTQGGERAGVISLVLVSLIAFVGLRSLRLVAATLITVVVSLVWTSGFAALAIGHLNLLSAAFAVLFIGVAMDFCVQFGLRVREARDRGRDSAAARHEALSRTGPAIILAGACAALGFLSFVPTDYRGLAELGIISGVGMLLGVFATLTLLPALLALMPIRERPGRIAQEERVGRIGELTERHAPLICAVVLLLGIVALAMIPRAGFEVDPVKLENPESPSVTAYERLVASSRTSPYSVSVVAPDLKAAQALAGKLEKLSSVGDVVTLDSFVPEQQEEKLDIISQMSLFLMPVFEGAASRPPPTLEENRAALESLVGDLDRLAASRNAGDLAAPAGRLAASLRSFARSAVDSQSAYRTLDRALLQNLPGRLRDLEEALGADKVTEASLPQEIRIRYLSADGRARVEIFPKRRITGTHRLRVFVDQVRTVTDRATGTAVLLLEGSDAVVNAFETSGVLAFIGVSLLLILALRSIVDWLLVALPLALALSFTIALLVLLDTKLNLANIMALPLLFSLGSAFGVYLVMRRREVARVGQLLGTSTPLAVLISALTTMASFGSLMVSAHRGMASMGELLAISLAMALVANLIALPALLAWRDRFRRARDGRR